MYSAELYFLLQLVYAMFLGGCIGWQRREFSGKNAGPRTHALVSVGSALFTILSLHAFPGDSTGRVAAQIMVGIGFIGAGMIFHNKDHVVGLTTAAGIWTTAAIGMAVGAKFYMLAAGTTFLAIIIFMVNDQRLPGPEKLPHRAGDPPTVRKKSPTK